VSSQYTESVQATVTLVERAITERLRKMDLVGIALRRTTTNEVQAALEVVLKDLDRMGVLPRPGWKVKVDVDGDVLSVSILPPLEYIPVAFDVVESKK
jgi:hypothetical protein